MSKIFALLTTEYPLMDRSRDMNHFRIPIDIMKNLGYECVVITGKKGEGHEEKDIRVIRTDQHKHISFLRAIKKIKPDFYHVQGFYLPILLSPFLYNAPGVHTPIGIPNDPLAPRHFKTDKIAELIWPIVTNKYKKIISLSESERTALIKLGSDPKKVVVIPHPIDASFFAKKIDRKKSRKKYGFKPDEKVILMISVYLWKRKNQLLLAKVAQKLSMKYKIKLVLTGIDGPDEKGYSEKIKQIIEEKNIVFTGLIKKEAIRELLYACDAYVVPSFETQGLAPMEAAAACCPLFLADVPAMHYWFKDIAIFHPIGDENTLAHQLEKHFNKPKPVNRKKISTLLAKTSMKNYKRKIRELYLPLINE